MSEAWRSTRPTPQALRARALLAAGNLAHYQGDDETAATHVQEGLDLYEELGDVRGAGMRPVQLGYFDRRPGRLRQRNRLPLDAREHFEAVEDDSYVLGAKYHLGVVALRSAVIWHGRQRHSRRWSAKRAARATESIWRRFFTYLGLVACEQGVLAPAAVSLAEALTLDQAGADLQGIIGGLAAIAVLAAVNGNYELGCTTPIRC